MCHSEGDTPSDELMKFVSNTVGYDPVTHTKITVRDLLDDIMKIEVQLEALGDHVFDSFSGVDMEMMGRLHEVYQEMKSRRISQIVDGLPIPETEFEAWFNNFCEANSIVEEQ